MSGTRAVEPTLADRRGPRAGGPLALAFSAAPTILLLGGLVLLATTVYAALGMRIETPWIMVDELIYSELAKGLADHGQLLVRDEGFGYLSFLYPLAIAPAWLASSTDTTYAVAKSINAALMSLTAVPVFLWARRLMTPTYALVTALLVLLMPQLLYSGMVMTENAFLPAFTLAAFAIALALEQPTLWRQGFALAAVGAAVLVRMQGLVLVLILLSAIVLDALLDGRDRSPRGLTASLRRRLFAFRYLLLAIGAGAAGYLLLKVLQGKPLSTGLGAYQAVGSADYTLSETARWSFYHAAELCLAAGFVPVSALLVLLTLAVWKGTVDPSERAFLAVAAPACVWLIIAVATFSSRFALRIEERNMFYLIPLLLIALGLWLSRGAPRPLPAAVFGAAVPALLVILLPLERFVAGTLLVSDTWGLIPIQRIASELDEGAGGVETLVSVAAFGAAQLFVFLPRRLAVTLMPAAVAVFFVLSAYAVAGAIRDYSRNLEGYTYVDDADWIDDRIGTDGDAVYLFGGGVDANEEASRLWQAEFWNRSLGDVYRVASTAQSGLLDIEVRPDPATGTFRRTDTGEPIRSEYAVVTAPGYQLAGKLVDQRSRLSLYRTPGTVGLASSIRGIYGDGWSGGSASYAQLVTPGQRAGRIRVVVSRTAWNGTDVPGTVRIRVGLPAGDALRRVTAERSWVVHSGAERIFTLPTPKPPFRVEVTVDPTFSPSSFGFADVRQLGAQVSFTFVPGRR